MEASSVTVVIDEQTCQAAAGEPLFKVAKAHGIFIPSLCYHPALRPSGACKLCVVEVLSGRSRNLTMLSCVLKVQQGLEVRTSSHLVTQKREKAFQNLLRMAPQAKEIRQLATTCGIDAGPPPDGCLRCRLCIRVCKEVVGPGALEIVKRDGEAYVVPIEGRCIGCGTCANICPTKVIALSDQEGVRTITIRDEVIGRHPLERCEGCGRLFATPRFLDRIHERTRQHPDVKAHHLYCPVCSKLFSDRIRSQASHTLK